MDRVRVAVLGAAGKMGRMLLKLIDEHDALVLGAALEREGAPVIGQDAMTLIERPASGIQVADTLERVVDDFDVLIDFSAPQSLPHSLNVLKGRNKAMVIGSTGLQTADQQLLRTASKNMALLHAPNMSLGMNLCFNLIAMATRVLGGRSDIEVTEAHHRHKKDAPSGTALAIGAVIADELKKNLADIATYQRVGNDALRREGTVGFSVVRGGDIVGDHSVLFAREGERIEIHHRANDRRIFAEGALFAAQWIAQKPAGLYSMDEVIQSILDETASASFPSL